jgi:hypothetical protein
MEISLLPKTVQLYSSQPSEKDLASKLNKTVAEFLKSMFTRPKAPALPISHAEGQQKKEKTPVYLQCTNTGPMSGVRAAEDLLTKVRTGRAYSGTPMSGHCV